VDRSSDGPTEADSPVRLLIGRPLTEARLAEALDHLAGERVLAGVREPAMALAARSATRALHVLLAEDNPVNARVVQDLLRACGHQVITVDNGQDAVAQVGGTRFDLVLMDRHMPGVDGLEATRRIRATPAGHNLPILGLTAAAGEADIALCREAGMDRVAIKDGDPEALLEVIEEMTT
jgi:CheY-like chemotaxis protein